MSIAPLAAVGPADSKLLEGLLDKIRQHDQSRVGEIRALRQQVEQLSSELARKNTTIKQLKSQLLQLSDFKRSIVQSINRNPAAAPDFLTMGDDDLPSAVGTSGASGASSGFDFGLYQPGLSSADNAFGAPEYPHASGLGGLGDEGGLALSAETQNLLAEIDRATDPFGSGATSPAFAGFGSATKQPLPQPQPFLRGGLGTNPFAGASTSGLVVANPGASSDFRFSQTSAGGSAPRQAVSPGRLRSATAPTLQPPPAANAGVPRPASPALSTRAPSTVPPPPPVSQGNGGGIGAGAPSSSAAPDMEGHEFFMTAKKQLSFQQFQQFLGIIKQFNQHERNKEQTLTAAREVFGPQHEALYKSFYALLTRAAVPA